MIKWDVSQGYRNGSVSTNKSIWYTTLTNWRNKKFISIDIEKVFDKILHPRVIKKKKNSQESEYRGNIPQYTKGPV